MNIKQWLKENTIFISIIMILIGIILKFVSDDLDPGFWKDLLSSFAVLFISVFFISILYEKFLAEKHLNIFMSGLKQQLGEMDSIQSKCYKFGIREIFESRNEFEKKFDLAVLFDSVKTDGKVFIVGRTMFHFFNKLELIKKFLNKGGNLEVALIDPEFEDKLIKKHNSDVKIHDIKSSLECVNELTDWMMNKKPKGTFHLKTHDVLLTDSFTYAELEERNVIFWDLSFGRDLTQKRVFVINHEQNNLGDNLYKRFENIWNSGNTMHQIAKNGVVV